MPKERALMTIPQPSVGRIVHPTGMFFNGAGTVPCRHDEDDHAGGTWHWPERV